jgi:hypothetical protein
MPPAPVVVPSVVPGPVVDESVPTVLAPPAPDDVVEEALELAGPPLPPEFGVPQPKVAAKQKRATKMREKTRESERRACKGVLASIQGKVR